MKKRNSGNGSQERCSQVSRDIQEERLGEFCQRTGTEEAKAENKVLIGSETRRAGSDAISVEQSERSERSESQSRVRSAHPSSVSEAVGLKIRYYREARGWSMRDMEAELAVAVNLPRTRSAISMWENNRRSCSIEDIPALCEVFGVTPNDLIEMPKRPSVPESVGTSNTDGVRGMRAAESMRGTRDGASTSSTGIGVLCGGWFGRCRVVPEQLKPLMPLLANLQFEDVNALAKLAETMAKAEAKCREKIRTIIKGLAELGDLAGLTGLAE